MFVALRLDGVTYLAGHREEVAHVEPVDLPPSREAADRVLRAFLDALEGDDRRLRAGWAAVRWLEERGDALAWTGPAYLYAFEAGEAGRFEVTFSGEDEAPWEPPE